MSHQKYVVITRPVEESKKLEKELSKLGLSTLYMPSIAIHKNELADDAKKIIQNIQSFDWIVFTSQNGIHFFIESLKELHIDISLLKSNYIAAVGSKTKEEIKKYGIPVQFTPSKFTTTYLAKELPNVEGKKILLPRANIATSQLVVDLKKRGAIVTNISVYSTEFEKPSTKEFETLLHENNIASIIFTSPSNVEGFIKNIEMSEIYSLPAIAIGPVTAASLKKHGFKNILIADTHTIEGLVTKVKDSIL